MTKSPDSRETGAVAASASAADEPRQGEVAAGTNPGAPSDEDDLALEVEVEPPEPTFEQRIAELEAKNKETYDRYLRSVAELDNFRKRTRKEIEDARIDAQARVLREMLPVVDNLERALAAAGGNEAGNGHSIVEGVRLVLRQFHQALERVGVVPVPAQGVPFDPAQHEAVSQMETGEAAPGSVVGVLQSGYRIGDRLLRPALVVVAKAPAGAASSEGDGDVGGSSDAGADTGEEGSAEPSGPNGHDPDAA